MSVTVQRHAAPFTEDRPNTSVQPGPIWTATPRAANAVRPAVPHLRQNRREFPVIRSPTGNGFAAGPGQVQVTVLWLTGFALPRLSRPCWRDA